MSRAAELDACDALRRFRDEFVVDDPALIYLDGNSLGRLPKRTSQVVADLLERQWGRDLVGGWRDWYDLPQRVGAKIAQLIGAQADEVLVCDSTSVNLFKLTVAALQAQFPRTKIVTDDANFPSDVYISLGSAKLLPPTHVEMVSVEDAFDEAAERIEGALDHSTALLSLSHTLFKSGYVYDMKRLTASAHSTGALVLWDLSHSVGSLPVNLSGSGADLAVGCSYKYVNGGPGAPAFLYVRRELQERLQSPIWGWFGHGEAFDFDLDYRPARGISRFLAGTPPILSMSAVEPGLDLLLEAGIERIRAKSLRQTEFLIEMIDARLLARGFRMVTPRDPAHRGSHVSLAHPDAWRISQALIREMEVVPDFRAPDVLRLGVTPLSTTFQELEEAVDRIAIVVDERRHEAYSAARARVT